MFDSCCWFEKLWTFQPQLLMERSFTKAPRSSLNTSDVVDPDSGVQPLRQSQLIPFWSFLVRISQHVSFGAQDNTMKGPQGVWSGKAFSGIHLQAKRSRFGGALEADATCLMQCLFKGLVVMTGPSRNSFQEPGRDSEFKSEKLNECCILSIVPEDSSCTKPFFLPP
jgi:hypothetical protein